MGSCSSTIYVYHHAEDFLNLDFLHDPLAQSRNLPHPSHTVARSQRPLILRPDALQSRRHRICHDDLVTLQAAKLQPIQIRQNAGHNAQPADPVLVIRPPRIIQRQRDVVKVEAILVDAMVGGDIRLLRLRGILALDEGPAAGGQLSRALNWLRELKQKIHAGGADARLVRRRSNRNNGRETFRLRAAPIAGSLEDEDFRL